MSSALPDFGIEPFLVLCHHRIVMDALYVFEFMFGKKSATFNQNKIKIVLNRHFVQQVASNDVSFGL